MRVAAQVHRTTDEGHREGGSLELTITSQVLTICLALPSAPTCLFHVLAHVFLKLTCAERTTNLPHIMESLSVKAPGKVERALD